MRIGSTKSISNILFSVPQSSWQEPFWVPEGFESNEESVMLSDVLSCECFRLSHEYFLKFFLFLFFVFAWWIDVNMLNWIYWQKIMFKYNKNFKKKALETLSPKFNGSSQIHMSILHWLYIQLIFNYDNYIHFQLIDNCEKL